MQLSDRIGRRMKLQDLHILMTVVEAGSMGKAAQRLNSTQPAISRSIAALEHALGVRLLDRYRQGIEPTEHGRALLDCGMAVFDDLRQGVSNIEALSDPSRGQVRIGSTAFLGASFVAAVVDRIARRYPRMVFQLVTATAGALHKELVNRSVDLLIVREFGSIEDDRMNFEFLFDDSFVVAAGVHNRWVRRRKITLGDLMDEPWVLPPPESSLASVAKEAFRRTGLDLPTATVTAVLPELRMSLLALGRFLSIFPSSVLHPR